MGIFLEAVIRGLEHVQERQEIRQEAREARYDVTRRWLSGEINAFEAAHEKREIRHQKNADILLHLLDSCQDNIDNW